MSVRRQLYERLLSLRDGDPTRRIASVDALLDGLPPDEAAETERTLLALAIAYETALATGEKSTLAEFFAAVEKAERRLVN